MTTFNAYLPFQSGFRTIDGGQLNRNFGNILGAAMQWPGNFFYVDVVNGSDRGDGLTPNSAFQSITAAYAACTAGNNDVVVLIGDGTTAATARLSATLTWAKDATHLIGICAPNLYAKRARISDISGATVNLNPMMTVSASGCFFQNFSFFQGVGQASTDENLIIVSGNRNYFQGVDFGGMGSTNGAARSGSYIINLTGSENTFDGCTIGLETKARSAANASILLNGTNAQRNIFIDCDFDMYPTANSPLFMNANTSGVLNGSTMKFQRCSFRCLISASGGTQPSVTMTINAGANGNVYFEDCRIMAAKYVAATALVKVFSAAQAATTGFSGGLYHDATDS